MIFRAKFSTSSNGTARCVTRLPTCDGERSTKMSMKMKQDDARKEALSAHSIHPFGMVLSIELVSIANQSIC